MSKCRWCGKDITPEEKLYSIILHGVMLCEKCEEDLRNHQEVAEDV